MFPGFSFPFSLASACVLFLPLIMTIPIYPQCFFLLHEDSNRPCLSSTYFVSNPHCHQGLFVYLQSNFGSVLSGRFVSLNAGKTDTRVICGDARTLVGQALYLKGIINVSQSIFACRYAVNRPTSPAISSDPNEYGASRTAEVHDFKSDLARNLDIGTSKGPRTS